MPTIGQHVMRPLEDDEFKAMSATLTGTITPQEGDNVSLSLGKARNDEAYEVCFTAAALLDSKTQDGSYYRTRLETSTPVETLQAVWNDYNTQRTCEHKWVHQKDENGNDFPDGRGTCSDCGLHAKKVMPKLPGRIITANGDEDIVARHPWPTDECGMQCGQYGKLDKADGSKSYDSAFVEVFPSINGLKTIIRGDADTTAEAEDICWEKYQKMMACESHELTREFKSGRRSDGYAQCTLCGIRGSFLEPETSCSVCGVKTSSSLAGEHMCYKHQYELSEDEYVSRYCSQKGMFGEDLTSYEASLRFKFPIMKAIIARIGSDLYSEHMCALISVMVNLEQSVADKINTDPKVLMPSIKVDDLSRPDVKEMQDSFVKLVPMIIKKAGIPLPDKEETH